MRERQSAVGEEEEEEEEERLYLHLGGGRLAVHPEEEWVGMLDGLQCGALRWRRAGRGRENEEEEKSKYCRRAL
jgi:hypothetical protein